MCNWVHFDHKSLSSPQPRVPYFALNHSTHPSTLKSPTKKTIFSTPSPTPQPLPSLHSPIPNKSLPYSTTTTSILPQELSPFSQPPLQTHKLVNTTSSQSKS